MSGPGYLPGESKTSSLRHYDGSIAIDVKPPADVPLYKPTTITPPNGVAEKELFAFPGVNWLEFFRDNVVGVARKRLHEARTTIVPLKVEPGNFDQADSIRTYFNNVKGGTQQNLDALDALLSNLQTSLTSQAEKYKTLDDAMSATVDGLGIEFSRAMGMIELFKPVVQGGQDPKA